MLQNGEDCGHGTSEVGNVEGHCHVDSVVGARVVWVRVVAEGGARGGVVEFWSFFETLLLGGGGAGA